MKVKVVKIYNNAKLPAYATDGSGCFDIFSSGFCESTHDTIVFNTGLRVEVPKGYVMLIYSRSGHGFNKGIRLANCVGVIDSDYRGEIKVKLKVDDIGKWNLFPEIGSAVAQGMIIPYEQVKFEEVDGLSVTDRGDGGFGSTDASVNTNKGNVDA